MNLSPREHDTIAAVATPPGAGGIAIVKISGDSAARLTAELFRGTGDPRDHDRLMLHGHIVAGDAVLDEVLVCLMRGPRSYTGEDVLEIHSHGGIAAARAILDAVLHHGARHADPGEFTRRAFLNGKIDLAQAEAVMEIVTAAGTEHLRRAEALFSGSLSRDVGALIDCLNDAAGLLEYAIEFSESETAPMPRGDIDRTLAETRDILNGMIDSYRTAETIRHGLTAVLAGPVNAGKSSLFNAILGRARAIVSDTPGTTRDWLEGRIELAGIPVTLVDTAGLRDADDHIEREGVRSTETLIAGADIVIRLHESAGSLHAAPVTPETIHLISKADIRDSLPGGCLAVSAKTRSGIPLLLDAMKTIASRRLDTRDSGTVVLVDRHRHELAAARDCLLEALDRSGDGMDELAAIDIRGAIRHLESVIGRTMDPDVLDAVFSRFCIGK